MKGNTEETQRERAETGTNGMSGLNSLTVPFLCVTVEVREKVESDFTAEEERSHVRCCVGLLLPAACIMQHWCTASTLTLTLLIPHFMYFMSIFG